MEPAGILNFLVNFTDIGKKTVFRQSILKITDVGIHQRVWSYILMLQNNNVHIPLLNQRNSLDFRIQLHGRQLARRTRKLFLHLVKMVRINMRIT